MNLPFVDTHVHFWDHSVDGLGWAWLDPDFEHPRVRSLAEYDAPRWAAPELAKEAEGTGLEKVVHVQAALWTGAPERETAWLESMAEEHGWPDATVGNVRLAAADAAEVIARQVGYPRFRGVRDLSVDPHLGEPAVRDACRAAGAAGALVELMVPWPAFPLVREMLLQCPSTTFVLGHAGLPTERTPEYHRHWRRGLEDLAPADNLVCKISALAGGADPEWTVESIRPWVLGCIEAFGVDRCMFGTNWPIDRHFGTYRHLVDAYRSVVAELPEADQRRLLAGTAEAVYRLVDG